jgi:hypothetical protein
VISRTICPPGLDRFAGSRSAIRFVEPRAGAEVLGEEQASIVDRRVPDDKPLIDPDVGGADVLSSRPESGSHPAFGDASWPYRVRNARTA